MTAIFDNRLRPVIEFFPASVLIGLAMILIHDPVLFFPLMPGLVDITAAVLGVLGLIRLWQGCVILRYRRQLTQLPHYELDAEHIPVSRHRLFLGRGFAWDQRHCQRLIEARSPQGRGYLEPSIFYRLARAFEMRFEHSRLLGRIADLARREDGWNPVRPAPPLGGDAALHGIGGQEEQDIWMPLSDRVGHTLVLGTTRVGKTRLAEVLIAQDIRRGETVIVFDPKGDVDLLRRMVAEATRSNRLDQFHVFHLGFPDLSERYNPVGEFGRVTEVATRIAAQLPSQGNSAAFREFAWRFTNIVTRALVGLGRKPDFGAIARYVTNIEPLLVDYYHLWLDQVVPNEWQATVQTIERNLDDKILPFALRGRDRQALALVRYAKERNLFDPVADGLRSAFEYDKTYFDKLTASLLPLLEKLTSGKSGELLAPDYRDLRDPRPILDWMRIIRQRGIVYVGLDALADPEVAGVVGNAMFADLTSIAGRLYKHGDTQGLPTVPGHLPTKIAIHADEFNELIGDEFIPLLNKAGGAGIQVTAYTQTASDIEAGIGDRAKAGQVTGNFNTLIMLRVKNEETATFLTEQLPKVRVYTKVVESRFTDSNDPASPVDFVTQNADRVTEVEADLLTPADLVQLPKGQAFALIEGGRLYKLRLPLPGDDPLLPKDMNDIRRIVLKQYGVSP